MHRHPSAPRRRTLPAALCCSVLAGVAVVAAAPQAVADEGMWLFDAPPLERLRHDHGMEASPAWLDRLRQSSVRFNSGGSGSFVSADGLVLTNHHVGAGAIQKLGTPDHDLMRDGFLAAAPADELRCDDLELNVLVSMTNVTSRVQDAVKPGLTADGAAAARRAVMAEIERESLAGTGLRSDVVTLHQGGAYHLYRYRKYTDVRLVFAPEQGIAFFGGDADNFEFPRFNLDCCFFRAWEEGKPARVPAHLAWAAKPVAEGDLVFVSGHPGHTDRSDTVAEITSLRDRTLPLQLQAVNRLETLFAAYAARGPEQRRQAQGALFGAQNARKARSGILAGLLDPRVFAALRDREAATRPVVEAAIAAGSAPRGDPVPSPYRRIEEAQAELDRNLLRHRLLEAGQAFNSTFFANARTILRAVTERAKPDGERLREYRESNRESLEIGLFSSEPLYDDFETAKLADSLTALATAVGGDSPLVQAVLDGKSPRDRAAALVAGTSLGHRPDGPDGTPRPDDRRALYEGGAAAVAGSCDPMLALARLVDDEARAVRKEVEAAGEVMQQAHAEITRARFARVGDAMYPDATFTLRLAYGIVKGYEDDGRRIPPFTTYAGLFARAAEKHDAPPFDLPPRWAGMRKHLEADTDFLATPFNFVSTADIIGGNSGSPVVNRSGELVGLIFDGNIHSLVLDVAYDDVRARAIAVDARGILAALRRVYRADALAAELAPPGRGPAR